MPSSARATTSSGTQAPALAGRHLAPTATNSEAARSRQWREIGLGAQILKDLGISSIRLITSRRLSYVGLGGFGIEIKDVVPLEG